MTRSLHIAWIGGGPPSEESGGAPGVATELLDGLSKLGHRIDCFLPGMERPLPARLAAHDNLNFMWGTVSWQWNRWYSKTKFTAFASGLVARGVGSLRLRRRIVRKHRQQRYDLLLQFSNIEALAAPRRLTREVPLVIFPSTHMAGEIRWLVAERRLGMRSQPRRVYLSVLAIRLLRRSVQHRRIRRADLLICKSEVFREHLVADYGFPLEKTVVVPNTVRLQRFVDLDREQSEPPTVLVLGRVAPRKGIEHVVAVARELLKRGVDAQVRVVGGPDLSSDYTELLEDLPRENAQYVGSVPATEVPAELSRASILLVASKYEPFGSTVAEALAAGVPVVATTQVGAIESVDSSVVAAVEPGDVEGMVEAIETMLERVRAQPDVLAATARSEAARLFAPDVVCRQFSDALGALVAGRHRSRREDSEPAGVSGVAPSHAER